MNLRLTAELKTLIDEAATLLGQSVSDYAISTLVQDSRNVLRQTQITELSNRDRDLFVAMLDDVEAKPNSALEATATRYQERLSS